MNEKLHLYEEWLLLPASTLFIEPVMGLTFSKLTLIVFFCLACLLVEKLCFIYHWYYLRGKVPTLSVYNSDKWGSSFSFWDFTASFPGKLQLILKALLHGSTGWVLTETKQRQFLSAEEAYQSPELCLSLSTTVSLLLTLAKPASQHSPSLFAIVVQYPWPESLFLVGLG